jgi:RimJ/RimL family protein N-acetyltransferase
MTETAYQITPWPLPITLWQPAAERLVATDPRETAQAAKRLIAHAADHGIDFANAVASFDQSGVRQVCLPVLGSGRTAMLFLSRPASGAVLGPPAAQHAERVEVLRTVLDRLRSDPRARLVQGLSLPSEHFAIEAYEAAGMLQIAELQYLSRPLAKRSGRLPRPGDVIQPPRGHHWPGMVEVTTYPAKGPNAHADQEFTQAIALSYQGTLDCPDLQKLRRMEDIITSHRDTGEWLPALWWLARLEGKPVGCLLLNPSAGDDSVELTYLGLGPQVRGSGLASALLQRGIEYAEQLGMDTVRCAVDTRNTPARRLYERAGFVPIGARIAHACSVDGV